VGAAVQLGQAAQEVRRLAGYRRTDLPLPRTRPTPHGTPLTLVTVPAAGQQECRRQRPCPLAERWPVPITLGHLAAKFDERRAKSKLPTLFLTVEHLVSTGCGTAAQVDPPRLAVDPHRLVVVIAIAAFFPGHVPPRTHFLSELLCDRLPGSPLAPESGVPNPA